MIVELTPLVAERGGAIWGPLGEEAKADLLKHSTTELEGAKAILREGIELNERHIERLRQLEF